MKVIVAVGVCAFDLDEFVTLGSMLAAAIGEQGHSVELVQLDADPSLPDTLVDQAAAIRSLRVDRADRLIAFGWPSHLLSHPRKVVWLSQRSILGGWGGNLSALDRDVLVKQEVLALRAAERGFALSRAAASSADRACKKALELLGLPLGQDASSVSCPTDGNEMQVLFRCNSNKRVNMELVFQGLAFADAGIRLTVLETEFDEESRRAWVALAAERGVGHRVSWAVNDPSHCNFLVKHRAVLDLSHPGADCGLWLDQAVSASIPAIVVQGGDTWEIVSRHPKSLQIVAQPEALSVALNSVVFSSPSNRNVVAPYNAIRRLDWSNTLKILLS